MANASGYLGTISITVSSGTLGTSQTISISSGDAVTIAAYSSDGDFLTYVCSNYTGTTVSFTPPLTWASLNTTGRYVYVTYKASSDADSVDKQVQYYIPSSVKPTIYDTFPYTITDANGYYSKYGAYVKDKSAISLSILSQGAYGAEVKKCTCYWGTQKDVPLYTIPTSMTYHFGSSLYQFTSDSNFSFSQSGSLRLWAYVTDARNVSSATSYKTITVLDYSTPVISELGVKRCDSDGTANDEGEYAKVTFSATVASLNSINSASYTLKYKKRSASEWTTVDTSEVITDSNKYAPASVSCIFAADTDSTYDISLTVTDDFGSASKTTVVSTAHVIMHFHKGGKGLALGKIAEASNILDVGYTSHFRNYIHAYKDLYLHASASTYFAVYCYLKDDDSGETAKPLIQRSSNGLYCYFGYYNSNVSTCKTVTYLNGYTVWLRGGDGGVYSNKSISVPSDRNLKKDICELDDKYAAFFKLLKPVSYKYDMPSSRGVRDHVGFVAQDVEDAINSSGLTTEQFAGICIQSDVTLGDEESGQTHYDKLYSLRYDEFIALNTHMIQRQQAVIEEQQAKINDLEARLSALEKVMESK